MEAGNHQEEELFGATLAAAHNFDSHSQSQSSSGPRLQHRYRQQQLGHSHPNLNLLQDSHCLSNNTTTTTTATTTTTFHHFDQHRPLPPTQLTSYAADNFHAANANATSIEPGGLVDPDDFYRTYRRVDSSDPVLSQEELMASTLPVSRQTRDASLRSNGSGSTSRHPTAPSTRAGLRPASRSASAPVDDKFLTGATRSKPAAGSALGGRNGHQPSVKDLKKRFDQNAAHPSNNTAGKTIPRIPTRETSSAAEYRGASSPSATNSQTSYTTLRSSVTRDLPTRTGVSSTTRSSQRSRAVAEDQLSNNSQSFASRIAKPRSSVGAHAQASKSMTNLSPADSPDSIPPVPQSRDLLFGEIEPGSVEAGTVGYGIEGARPRRTSESNLQDPSGLRQRSLSHTDAKPPSPSDWYRNGDLVDPEDIDSGRPKSKSHSRSRSDLAGTRPVSTRTKTPQTSRLTKPNLNPAPPPTSSRLPVSVRKLNSPSGSSSPSSTRSNSPSTRKRPPVSGKLTKSVSTTSAKTPTSNNSTPATKQTPNRLGAVTPNSNARLNAYISAPPPKLSPPLRSSRPRQPVSAATTTSSRMKAVERGKSPSNFDSKTSTRLNEPTTRRRKISMGPIDFESRREQIKLSYTKSIRETEARVAARRVAEEKRKKAEVEAEAARAAERAGAEQRREFQRREEELREELREELTDDSLQSPVDIPLIESPALRTITAGLVTESPADAEAPASEQPPLRAITTGLARAGRADAAVDEVGKLKESPTLGIPGSFPDVETPGDQDEAPPSAISNTTEFDAEPQTEPPLQDVPKRQAISTDTDAEDYFQPAYPKTEYRSPFEDETPNEDGVSIKISLGAPKEAELHNLEPHPAPSHFNAAQEVASPERREEPDDEYEPKPFTAQTYQTKVTILRRDSDFPSSTHEVNDISTILGPAQSQDVSEISSQPQPPRSSRSPSYGERLSLKDEQPTPSAALSDIEEFFVGPIIKDPATRHQDSAPRPPETAHDVTASGNYATDETRYSTDSRRTMGTRPSLTVPRTSDSMYRASQTTVWTDYSVNSQDAYPDYVGKEQSLHDRHSAYRDDCSVFESDPRSQPYQYDRGSRGVPSSRGISPHDSFREPELYEQQHRLPELDTGDGFVVDYSRKNSTTMSSIPVLPDHSPPPPPDEISFRDAMSSAPPSEYFDDTRPSSYFHAGKDDHSVFSMDPSRRDSEELGHSESAGRSIDQGSLEISEGFQSGSSRLASQQTLAESIDQTSQTPGLSDKEKKRLFTRLETIKELIDTEAFFIRDMNIVEEIYKGTAEACPQLDDQTIKLIFRNTDQIIKFHAGFLVDLKEGVSSVYTPKGHRTNLAKDPSNLADGAPSLSAPAATSTSLLSDDKDRETSLGPTFIQNVEKMKAAHETFLKNSDHAAKRLIQIQEDPTVKVWLNECNEVARDLTKAWNLDSLLIKPMQRITKYPNLLIQLLHETPADHPDRPSLESAKAVLENAIEEINKTKKNFELVGQIVGRKRKDSDVRAGFARAFGKRVDKLQAATNRPSEDPDYLKLHEKFGDDYLRLQVVLRDVEFYTRQVTEYVHEFLQYLSSMELVMRLQPSPHPEIESKWVRFNVSMRDIEKVALEQHLSQVRKQVIEPFELVIKSYGNPSLAMKKRGKRRLDYEKSVQLKKAGKKVDKQLAECVEQYDALNEALKKELPKLSALTEKVGNICLGNFVNIQTQWFAIWKDKVKAVLESSHVPEVSDIISTFQRDYKFQDEEMNTIGIVNPASKGRPSQSMSTDDSSARLRPRLADLSPRNRGLSVNSDVAPTLPTPDFLKHSGQFTISPSATSIPSPHQYYYRDYYTGIDGQTRTGTGSSNTPELSAGSRSLAAPQVRPGTGQSYDSGGVPRQSIESAAHSRRYSNSMHASPYQAPDNQRYSGLFQSALPLSEEQERPPQPSQASSRASSRERAPINGFNVLWLAASLFEFNIETTKHEAGYPYLTYQAGEIFDVIAEKGELWLAKNQDDPNNLVGWLWSKHFAKLADD